MQLSIFVPTNISRGLNESFKLKGFIRARTLTGGGLKWFFVICSACASQVVAPFFARTLTGGGLKWTRTIDLTLIRRVL